MSMVESSFWKIHTLAAKAMFFSQESSAAIVFGG